MRFPGLVSILALAPLITLAAGMMEGEKKPLHKGGLKGGQRITPGSGPSLWPALSGTSPGSTLTTIVIAALTDDPFITVTISANLVSDQIQFSLATAVVITGSQKPTTLFPNNVSLLTPTSASTVIQSPIFNPSTSPPTGTVTASTPLPIPIAPGTSSSILPTDTAIVTAGAPLEAPSNLAPSTSHTSSSHNGVSKGVLAGTAAASFLVGLTAAALIIWASLGFRRRRNPNRFSSSATTPIIAGSSENSSGSGHKYVPLVRAPAHTETKELPPIVDSVEHGQDGEQEAAVAPLSSSSGTATAHPLSGFTIKRKRVSTASASGLAASADPSDRAFYELRTQVKILFEQIEMHVDNFYSSNARAMRLTQDQQENLQQVDSPFLPDSVVGLLPEAQGDGVKTLVKHCLAYAIFSRIESASPNIDITDTLLPSGLLSVLHTILPATAAGRQKTESSEQEEERRRRWKHDTVAVMDIPNALKSKDLQTKMAVLAETCVDALEPWSEGLYGSEARRSHLMRIMEEAVEAGLIVFGERRGWLKWRWEQSASEDVSEGTIDDNVVMFPGLDLLKELVGDRAGSRAEQEIGMNARREDKSNVEVVFAPIMATVLI